MQCLCTAEPCHLRSPVQLQHRDPNVCQKTSQWYHDLNKGVHLLQERFQEIVPEAEVDARVAMYSEEAEEVLLEGRPDFVLDAIDNINTKVALLAACKRRGIPVLCAAGAGDS